MQVIGVTKLFVVFCLIGNVFGAPSSVIFGQSETTPPITEGLKFSDSETDHAQTEATPPQPQSGQSPTQSFFPSAETESDSVAIGDLKAPDGIVPAPIAGTEETDGRTLNHLAKLHYKIDQKLQHFLYKLASPWLHHYQGDPHHFPHDPYYQYDNEGIYRKDVVTKPTSPLSRILTPLAKAPQYFINHPINFKQGLANLHHAIGKRSVNEEDKKSDVSESARQGKTLDKIIPGFEERMAILMKKMFGDLYGSHAHYNNAAYKSDRPIPQLPNLGKMVESFVNFVGQQLRKPVLSLRLPLNQKYQ